MDIYVGNLGYDVTDNDLKAVFEAYGEVASARIIMDRDAGRSKGFGFVEMPKKEEALKAIEALNETELSGRKIIVNESRPKPKGDKRSGGRYGGGGRSGGGYGGAGGRAQRGGSSGRNR